VNPEPDCAYEIEKLDTQMAVASIANLQGSDQNGLGWDGAQIAAAAMDWVQIAPAHLQLVHALCEAVGDDA
jgi:hypothetical protein